MSVEREQRSALVRALRELPEDRRARLVESMAAALLDVGRLAEYIRNGQELRAEVAATIRRLASFAGAQATTTKESRQEHER